MAAANKSLRFLLHRARYLQSAPSCQALLGYPVRGKHKSNTVPSCRGIFHTDFNLKEYYNLFTAEMIDGDFLECVLFDRGPHGDSQTAGSHCTQQSNSTSHHIYTLISFQKKGALDFMCWCSHNEWTDSPTPKHQADSSRQVGQHKHRTNEVNTETLASEALKAQLHA